MNAPETYRAVDGSGKLSLPALFAIAGGLGMAAGHWLIFAYAPEERIMGLIQKVFYLHMPLAWWALFSFFLVFLFSVIHLVKRTPKWDLRAEAAAEIGLLMAALALVTGSFWARVSWNTWWTWDPRLSTTLIMWFIYAGYMLVRKLDFSPERRAVVSAVIGIIAFIDVPLVFFSTRLWPQTMHPAVVGGGGLAVPEMRITLAACLVGLGLFWLALLIWRSRLGMQQYRLNRLKFGKFKADNF